MAEEARSYSRLGGCPVCSKELRSLEIVEEYDVKPLKRRIPTSFSCCELCGFVCQTEPLSFDEIRGYYQDSPRLRESTAGAADTGLYEAQSRFMASAGDLRDKRVVDIGADMGKLLDFLKASYSCRTFYQEENIVARRWLEQGGRHREAADLADAGPFDWIVLSEVLEHIVDPVAYLTDLRTYLANDGKIFIEVPHHGFWDELDYGFSFEHVNYFSSTNLLAALDRAGFYPLNLAVTTDQRDYNGQCRIIRASAQAKVHRSDAVAAAVHDHRRKYLLDRFLAIKTLSEELMPPAGRGLALYGAAELASLLFHATQINEDKVVALFDSDPRKQGKEFEGMPVLPPSEIARIDPGTIVILSAASAQIRQTIAESGYRGRTISWTELTRTEP